VRRRPPPDVFRHAREPPVASSSRRRARGQGSVIEPMSKRAGVLLVPDDDEVRVQAIG
jgi:hypothetical protein